MGMHTELNICVDLNNDIPSNVIHILNYMIDGVHDVNVTDYNAYIKEIERDMGVYDINHALFDTKRWRWMLRSDSYYFDGFTYSKMKYDNIGKIIS